MFRSYDKYPLVYIRCRALTLGGKDYLVGGSVVSGANILLCRGGFLWQGHLRIEEAHEGSPLFLLLREPLDSENGKKQSIPWKLLRGMPLVCGQCRAASVAIDGQDCHSDGPRNLRGDEPGVHQVILSNIPGPPKYPKEP